MLIPSSTAYFSFVFVYLDTLYLFKRRNKIYSDNFFILSDIIIFAIPRIKIPNPIQKVMAIAPTKISVVMKYPKSTINILDIRFIHQDPSPSFFALNDPANKLKKKKER